MSEIKGSGKGQVRLVRDFRFNAEFLRSLQMCYNSRKLPTGTDPFLAELIFLTFLTL